VEASAAAAATYISQQCWAKYFLQVFGAQVQVLAFKSI